MTEDNKGMMDYEVLRQSDLTEKNQSRSKSNQDRYKNVTVGLSRSNSSSMKPIATWEIFPSQANRYSFPKENRGLLPGERNKTQRSNIKDTSKNSTNGRQTPTLIDSRNNPKNSTI